MSRRSSSNVAKRDTNVNLPTLEEVDHEGSSSIDHGFSSSSLRQANPSALRNYTLPLSGSGGSLPSRGSNNSNVESNRTVAISQPSSSSSGGVISRFGRFGSSVSRTTIITSSSDDSKISTDTKRRSSWVKKRATKLAAARVYRGYSIGDCALVMTKGSRLETWLVDNSREFSTPFDLESNESNEDDDDDLCLLNKYGFPEGQGKYPLERKGPYSYLFCMIKRVHYEENEVFWTVIREDNGQEMRGDARYMTPIHTKEGLLAAERATAISRAKDNSGRTNEDNDGDRKRDRNRNGKKRTFMSYLTACCWVTCCLPLLCIDQCFGMIKASEAYAGLLRHAKNVLDGKYMISFRVTSDKVIVLVSIWYLFVDDIQLAFLHPSTDQRLAWVNLVVWIVLVLELVFEAFIRPEGWSGLIRSDKAYTPHTARFISGFHLLVESISLLLFVPIFYCVFLDEDSCSRCTRFSFFEASVRAVLGPKLPHALVGRIFHGAQRWRIFGLVRHWRNAWINHAFPSEGKKKKKLEKRRRKEFLRKSSDEDSTSTISDDEEDDDSVDEYNQNLSLKYGIVAYGENNSSNDNHRQQQRSASKTKKDNNSNESKIKATNIGTALMIVNSHRSLFLFCFLASVFPMVLLKNDTSVVDPSGLEMVEYLQAINLQDAENYIGEDYPLKYIRDDDSMDCDYLFESVKAWANTMDPSFDSRKKFLTSPLVSVSIKPPRCYDRFNSNSSKIGNLKFRVRENCSSWSWRKEPYTGPCIYGALEKIADAETISDAADALNLRVGSLHTFESNSKPSNLAFAVSATYNYSEVVRKGAMVSFFLEILLFGVIILMLVQLRADLIEIALGSLRSMLRIIARYASNPLASPGRNEVYQISSDTASHEPIDDEDFEEEDNQYVRNYETEQLVSAVTKITDLLRKCWGVAGANIISTNLASRDGDIEVFNPTVPGKNVFALFAFATITDFDRALKGLGGDVMILINDVASVLHNEVFRWGFGDSGQCNRNLGNSFVMVFKIGSVMEVVGNLEEATQVVFSTGNGNRRNSKNQGRVIDRRRPKVKSAAPLPNRLRTGLNAGKDVAMEAMAEAMQLPLERIPGISTFADRAVIGMLKSFAGINRDSQLRAWSRDFRLAQDCNKGSNDSSPWSVNMLFGMDAGWAVEGAVGSKYKIDATYLSPHMNMAARMMTACKHYGVTILLSQDVRDLLSEPAKSKMRNLDRVTVKGSSNIQNIYTYDALAKGADFFLYCVSDEQADQQAKNYEPNIWNTDPDLRAMRNHITEDFEQDFNAGMKAYYDGDWEQAIKKLEEANSIMVEAAIDEDDLRYELNNSPEQEELYRNEASDQPCMYLINFMKSKGGKAPDDWDGWHPLLSK